MGFAYVIEGINKQTTGFEGFMRHTKTAVNPNEDFYIFDGADEVNEFIAKVREELKDPELVETFIELIEPKITAPNKDELIQIFRENWEKIDKDFEFTVVPNGTIVFPYVPVFQFRGDKMIGQMLETPITNIYNGRTGMATIKYLKENGTVFVSDDEYEFLTKLMSDDIETLNIYASMLANTAGEFRESTDKILLEAAFRRAPSKTTADIASKTAIANGWNGTSNVSVVLDGTFTADKIGGTMAHAFVMSYENEADAFKAWDKIFPGTTMLIDTYDVEKAAKMIDRMVTTGEITVPKEVRIDSDPLDTYAMMVNNIFGGKMGIFVSGDMSVDKFEHFEAMKIPYTKAMAGTKYCYSSMIVEKLNCGFVYKIVEFEKDGKKIRPEKKATGKKNYSGLKHIVYDDVTDTLEVRMGTPAFGYRNIDKATPNTNVRFVEN
jgi:nicotinic acid phosphoribosyltransferase